MKYSVKTPATTLDPEATKRKQIFLLLDSIEFSHDAKSLVEMNGTQCATRQLYKLQTYHRPQKPIKGLEVLPA